MKLELKHLAPYLPYKLRIASRVESKIESFPFEECKLKEVVLINDSVIVSHKTTMSDYVTNKHIHDIKPILRPITSLYDYSEESPDISYIELLEMDDELDFFADSGLPMLELLKCNIWELDLLPYGVVDKLFEWHFDVFGLIKEGLAIDINTI